MSKRAAKLDDITPLKALSAGAGSSDKTSTKSQTTAVSYRISGNRADVAFAKKSDSDESQYGVSTPHFDAHVRADYSVIVTSDRKFADVSDSFCKLLGYRRDELIGKKYDDFTAPMTNDIAVVLELFIKAGYMHGVWILVHRRGTKLLVRYESWVRPDGRFESHMELLGAGA